MRSRGMWASKYEMAKLLYKHGNERLSKLGKNISHCGRVKYAPSADLTLNPATSRASILGIKHCKNVHCCPRCSAAVAARRKADLDKLMQAARAAGCSVFLLTQTFQHKRGDALASILGQFKAAQKGFRQSRAWRKLKPVMIGTVSCLEITHGEAHSWHPHAHWLVILRLPADEGFKALDALRPDWLAALKSAGLHGGKAAWQLQDGSAAQNYIAKFGPAEAMELTASKEMALSGSKRGRNGSRTPFQILDDYRDGDKQSGALLLEYAAAMVGKRALIFSNGLKAWAGIDDISDDEAAAADDGEPDAPQAVILRQWFDNDHWRHASRRRVSIVHAAQTGGSLDAAEFGPTDAEIWWRHSQEAALIDPD